MTAAAQPPAESQPEPRSPRLNEQMRSLLGSFSQEPVVIPRPYIGLAGGDLSGGYMINQVIYWSDRGGKGDGTFYKSMKDWEAETGLGRHTINKWLGEFEARGWLISMGLKKAHGAPTKHWQFSPALFLDDLLAYLRGAAGGGAGGSNGRNQQIPESPKSANGMAENGDSLTIDYNNRLQHKTITEGGQPLEGSEPSSSPSPQSPAPPPPQEFKPQPKPQRAKAKARAEDSPAVQAYLAWVLALPPGKQVTPTRGQLEEIADKVRGDEASLEIWRATLKRWELAGYYAGNVLNLIDSYKKGGPSKDGNRAPPPGPQPPPSSRPRLREKHTAEPSP